MITTGAEAKNLHVGTGAWNLGSGYTAQVVGQAS